ncbi:hypothetical protein SBADM41S_03314 [Streptomyces badius]
MTGEPNTRLSDLFGLAGWSKGELARMVNRQAAAMGHPQLATDTSRVRRWIDMGESPRDPVPEVLAALFTERLGRVVTIEDLGFGRRGRVGKRRDSGTENNPDQLPWAPERTAAVLTEFTGMDLMLNRPLDVLLALYRRAAPGHGLLAAAQLADVPQDRPHGGRAALGSRTGSPVMCSVRVSPSGRTIRNSPSIGRPSTRQPVTMAVSTGWSSGSSADGRSSRERGAESSGLPKISYSSSDQLDSSVRRFRLGAAHPAQQGTGLGVLRGFLAPRGGASGARARQTRPELAQMLAEGVQVVHGQLAQGALPAQLRVVLVGHDGVPPHGVHISAQSARPVDQVVDRRRARGRLWCGAVREEGGRHLVLRCRRGLAGSEGGPLPTVAQAAAGRKGFGDTRCVVASGICQRLAEMVPVRTGLRVGRVDWGP